MNPTAETFFAHTVVIVEGISDQSKAACVARTTH